MDLLASLGLNGQEAEDNAVSYALYLDGLLTRRKCGAAVSVMQPYV